jgi:hypothetical protein
MKKGCRREGLRPALKRQVGAPAVPPWERNMVIYLWVGTTEDFFGVISQDVRLGIERKQKCAFASMHRKSGEFLRFKS